MDARDFEAIFNVARRYQASGRVSIVELGSGVSTLVFASVLPRLLNDFDLTSIEGEENYARDTRERLCKHGLDHNVTVSWVPYAPSDNDVWFSKPELAQLLNEKRVDMLIVDAPPSEGHPRARRHAIPFFLPYLKQQAIVMLHDASRSHESLIAKEWRGYFQSCRHIKTPRGLAVFEGRSD